MSSDESAPRPRRATVACTFCRQRKRKCNGQRPICANCAASNVECRYAEVEQRRFDAEAAFSAIADRLDKMESALREHSNALDQLKSANSPSVPTYGTQFSQTQSSPNVYLASPHGSGISPYTTTSGVSVSQRNVDPALETTLPPMTIPLWHSTTTGSLLSCPLVRSLLGDYPSDIFLRIEERRSLPDQLKVTCTSIKTLTMPILDREITDNLMGLYFQSVNQQHPILTYDDCISHYQSVVSEPLRPCLESCLVLLILALAEAATAQPSETLDLDWSPGSTYFLPALTIALDSYLNDALITPDLPQCLYLAALYYNYLARPLDSWKLVHMASTSFQRVWIRSKPSHDVNETQYQPLIRLCWAIFSLECDLIAEHHLPRSGIENLVERLHLPLCGDPPDPALLSWLAELSSRRLLNRVHHVMYADDQKFSLQADYVTNHSTPGQEQETIAGLMRSSLNVSKELDVQLSNWYDLIPQIIKPDLSQTSSLSIQDAMIVLRYHSAKDIIFRPFFIFACSLPSTIRPPQSLIEICQTTVYCCRQYIQVAARRLSEPSASTEIVIHSVFASAIIVTLAALNPWLAEGIQDIDEIQRLSITIIQRWAFPGSCMEAMALMLGAIANKTKMLQMNNL